MYDLLCKAALRNPIKSYRVIVRVIIQVIVRVMERFYDSDDDLEAIVRAIMISHSPGLSASHWSSWVHWSTGPGSTQAGPLVHWSTGPLPGPGLWTSRSSWVHEVHKDLVDQSWSNLVSDSSVFLMPGQSSPSQLDAGSVYPSQLDAGSV